jgi:ATP-dependent Lhr-like helicase
MLKDAASPVPMPSDRVLVERLGPVGRAFFGRRFQALTEIQRQAIEPIMSGHSLLVAAATASGKTEALCAPLVARLRLLPTDSKPHIRLLVVAPTRALVNDLFSRLSVPLADLGWDCGRQTSDHRDKRRRPVVLITTPESFDSMLVRDGARRDGQTVDHLLAGVEAVFIDEVHLFDDTARGDQLIWLLERLARLRRFAAKQGLTSTGALQVCGGSATVSAPDRLARRLLGADARALSVPGSRTMQIFERDDDVWRTLKPGSAASQIRDRIAIIPGKTASADLVDLIWKVLRRSDDRGEICRKLLVFVPTRRLCDELSVALGAALTKRRAMQVLAHHGSLERVARERAETQFGAARDAALVATTTLEVGVDIGDVDAVVLVGPPPNTGALLQRVGRAGRRTGITRILPIARDRIEQAAFGSLLANAREGMLDEGHEVRRWSVYVQQCASFIAQHPKGRRSRRDLIDLARSVWPDTACDSGKPERILDHLCRGEHLLATRDVLSLGDDWSNRFGSGMGDFHGNIDADRTGRPVVDASTGEVIAHVQGVDGMSGTIDFGGQRWTLVGDSSEILLKSARSGGPAETFRYGSRRAPTRRAFARHVLLGFGYAPEDAPVIEVDGAMLWWHCGGSAYERILLKLFPDQRSVAGFDGLAISNAPEPDRLADMARRVETIRELVASMADPLARLLSPGPWYASLPDDVRREFVIDLFGVEQFARWLGSRRVKGTSGSSLARGSRRGESGAVA